MIERLCGRHIVLLGIGHTNAHVVRMWRMQAPPDTDLTCISDNSIATYSGMLPAVLAGQVPPEQMQIDLVQLCAWAGARLITAPVTGIDHHNREVQFSERPPVRFDAMSIGIGSTANIDDVSVEGQSLVLIKPMQTFLQRLGAAIESAEQRSTGDPLRIVVVGSGAAGIEITCCVPSFVASVTHRAVSLRLVTRSDAILPDVADRTRRLVAAELDRRGIDVSTGRTVTRVTPEAVFLDDGEAIDADVVIWATGASPPTLLAKLDLALDPRGFLATDHTLQSTSAPGVFAVGDTGTIIDETVPKAGVYAVRQGPVLWDNLRKFLDGSQLRKYEPQKSFLKLINLGDGRAVGQWRGFGFSGRWAMRLKHSIDTQFMKMFRELSMTGNGTSDSGQMGSDEMQCRGCGCKLGPDVLESALASSTAITFDDAAKIGGDAAALIASTDFFSSPVDDAYLAGRIAALHCASDIIASGAQVTEALANVVLPEGDRATQQRTLGDFLSGAELEFDAMNAAVVGGHTIVGPRMEIGFTVIGKPIGQSLIRRQNLRPGDHLYLTKPLGIGVLLAAQMRGRCPARDYEALVSAMLQRQHDLARVAVDAGIDAGTDVTGFGLAGHLIEMLTASEVAAVIQLDSIPTLPGSMELVALGAESSLTPDNLRAESDISIDSSMSDTRRTKYRMLFDPQTCGGLLLGAGEGQHQQFLEQVVQCGLPSPAHIGRVIDREDSRRKLTVE